MSLLQDRIQKVEWMADERVMRLDWGAEGFFRRVHHVCDKNGIFEARAPVLRSRLYAADRRVSDQQVEAWLAKCESVGLLAFRAHHGLRLGKVLNWTQKLTHTKALYPWPEEGQAEMDFATSTGTAGAMPAAGQVEPLKSAGPAAPAHGGIDAAPAAGPVGARSRERNDMKGKGGRAKARRPSPELSQDDWVLWLQKQWPQLDVKAELAKALRRKPDLERLWFAEHWLPNCSPRVAAVRAPAAAQPDAGPAGWLAALLDLFPECAWAPGGLREGSPWATVPADIQARVRSHLAQNLAAKEVA